MSAWGEKARERDWATLAGMLVVAAAGATLSFTSLMDLAHLCGFPPELAWLLPISIDAYAVTATRVWLGGGVSERTRRYARRNAVGAIVLSVAGNATFHSLSAAGVHSLTGRGSGELLVIAVSAAPPVMLGLVGHLHALLSAEDRNAPAAATSTPNTAERDSSRIATPAPRSDVAAVPAPRRPAAAPVAGPDPLAAGREVPSPARREAAPARAAGSKSHRLRELIATEVAPGDARGVSELARVFAPRVGAHEAHARKVIAAQLRDRDEASTPNSRDQQVAHTETHENTDRDNNVVQLAVAGRGGQQG